jgi:hypothetical protein
VKIQKIMLFAEKKKLLAWKLIHFKLTRSPGQALPANLKWESFFPDYFPRFLAIIFLKEFKAP